MLSVFKRTIAGLLAAVMVCGTAVSCGGFIFEDEGDCSVSYRVRFRYDWNIKFADAFAHEVRRVTLYVLDEDGGIVLTKTESGDNLAAEGYSMEIDVPAGKYELIAWCDAGEYRSWASENKEARREDLVRTLDTKRQDNGSAYTDGRLDYIYYGHLSEADFTADEGQVTVTMPLMKDTNNFRVVLQHLSGKPVDKDKFDFFITDDNGKMDWDNSLQPCDSITYRAWSVSSGSAEVGASEETFGVALAELTTGRLVTGHRPRLSIRNRETGAIVISVPLIDYALLIKGHYNEGISDQEYLDRQDEYNMVFFLDKNENWVNTYIYINSWKVVLQNTDL